MTGLDYKKDRLLEIAVLITNGNLDVVDPDGLNYIIKTDKDTLDNMDPWCVKQHGEVSRTLQIFVTLKNAVFSYARLFDVISSLV
jgi:oligoribonuclease